MKKITVLGPGCPRCNQLAAAAEAAAVELGIEYELVKITDITRFADFGVMMTPGLVIDGKLALQGKIPSMAELKTMLA